MQKKQLTPSSGSLSTKHWSHSMSVFLTSLQNVLPIILIIVLGYVLRKINWLNETFASQASKLIMNVVLPASIFVAVLRSLSLNQLLQLGPSVLIAAVSFALSYIVGFLVINVFRVQPGRRGLMLNTFANANTIFIGMPHKRLLVNLLLLHLSWLT